MELASAEGRDASLGRFAAESSPPSSAAAATENPCMRLLPPAPASLPPVAGVGPFRGGDLDLVPLDMLCARRESDIFKVQTLRS